MPLKVTKLVRFNEWWNSKVAMLIGFGFWLTAYFKVPIDEALPILLFILFWLVIAASLGYFINDTFDIEADKLANKSNLSAKLSPLMRAVVIICLSVVSIGIWFGLGSFPITGILAGAQIMFFLLYSVRPFRLKDRLYLAVITDAIYAQLLPVAIIYSVFYEGLHIVLPAWLLVILGVWALASGCRFIMEHLIKDYYNDQRAGTYSLVHQISMKKANSLISHIFSPIEIVAFFVVMVFSASGLTYYPLWFGVYFVFIFFGSSFGENIKQYNLEHSNESDYKLLNYFYEIAFPLINLIYLCVFSLWYLPVIAAHIFLFRPARNAFFKVIHDFKEIFTKGFYHPLIYILVQLYYKVILQIAIFIQLMARRAVNYSIYYFRIYVLKYDEKRARGEKSEQRK